MELVHVFLGMFLVGGALLFVLLRNGKTNEMPVESEADIDVEPLSEEVVSRSTEPQIKASTAPQVLLSLAVITLWIIGLAFDRGATILTPWSHPEKGNLMPLVLSSTATGALVIGALLGGVVWAIYAIAKKHRDGKVPAGSVKVALITIVLLQAWALKNDWDYRQSKESLEQMQRYMNEAQESTRDEQASRDAQYYLDQATTELKVEEEALKKELGWLPIEPHPKEVDRLFEGPVEVFEGGYLERAYTFGNKISAVLRLDSTESEIRAEDWDSIYFNEFWLDKLCNDPASVESLRLGGVAEYIAFIDENQVLSRAQFTIQDCQADQAQFDHKVPMVKSGGVYSVTIHFNDNLSGVFVVDSGASDLFISPLIASELRATGLISDSRKLGSQLFVLADGSSEYLERYRIESISFGGKEVRDVVVAVNTDNDGLLLLGQSVLEKLGRYSIDYSRQLLVF